MVQCSFVEMLSHLKNRESTAALRPSSYDRRKRARIGDVVLILRTDTVLATTIADFDGLETRTGSSIFSKVAHGSLSPRCAHALLDYEGGARSKKSATRRALRVGRYGRNKLGEDGHQSGIGVANSSIITCLITSPGTPTCDSRRNLRPIQ